MIDFTYKVLASGAFFLLGLGNWISGEQSFREIFSDVVFLWTGGSEGDIYYGVEFTD